MTPIYLVIVSDVISRSSRYYAFSSNGNAQSFINLTQKQMLPLPTAVQGNLAYTTIQLQVDPQ